MLKAIRMKNCQSFDDVFFDLASDRVNVLKADNNTGKSILFKILKVIADPKHYSANERKELVKWGQGTAYIGFTFDDNTGAVVAIYSGNGTVVYNYEGKNYLQPPKELLEKIGLLTSDGFIANLIDTEQDLVLVNPKLAANYSLMSLLVHSTDLETLQEHVTNCKEKVRWSGNILSTATTVLTSQLADQKYVNVDKMESELEILQNVNRVLYNNLVPAYASFESLYAIDDSRDFEMLNTAMDTLEVASGIQFDDLQVTSWDKNLLEICDALETLNEVDFSGLEITEWDSSLSNICDVLEVIEDIQVDNLKVEDWDESLSEVCDALAVLSEIQIDTVCVDSSIAEQIRSLKQQLQDANAFYECPIKGRVIYDGETCIPYNK